MSTDSSSLDDAVLVERARDGDRDAFSALVQRYQDAVFRIVRRVSRQVDEAQAEDLAQETFLRAYRALHHFRGESSFAHWLFRIANNLTINRVTTVAARAERRAVSLDAPLASRHGDESMDPADDKQKAPSAGLEQKELKVALAQALTKIPDEFRSAIVLRDVEGLEYEAIASILEVPIGTVRSRLHRGREALREIITRIYGIPALESADGGPR